MTSYELSISAEYVPSWGIVEAVREFFQNAVDEETRVPDNKMFFNYDHSDQILRIGNRHGKLDARSLLLGYTEKNSQKEMIGNHGEGYKIATVVLLRLNKQLTFYNYGCRQIWRPRFVKSRKYKALVPTFFVETKPVWEHIPDNDLVIEISGVTSEEYQQICESNLHLVGDYDKISTRFGDLLLEERHKSKVFVGGLYICDDAEIDLGIDLRPELVRLERDRSMVDTFDIRYYFSKMVEASNDIELLSNALLAGSAKYVYYNEIPELSDRLVKRFLDRYGYDAVPVADQSDTEGCLSTNTIVVPKSFRDLILASKYYKDNSQIQSKDESSISTRLIEFCDVIKSRLDSTEVEEFVKLIKEVQSLEDDRR